MSVRSSFSFRNISNYIVEPVGEPIITQPANYSIDFSPQSSCIEEAPDDGKQYARQNKSWSEVSGTGTVTKEDVTGLKVTDSPEFADTQITPLASESTYTPTVWGYLVSLFTNVPKSVKAHIVKTWTAMQDLSSRVTTLENDIRDFSVTVTQDVASIELTNLNIPRGAVIHLTADWVYTADVPVSLYRLEFNDVVSGYMNTGISATAYINLYAPLSEDGQTQAVIYFADTITAMTMNIRKATGTSPTLLNITGSRPNFPDNVINTIRIRTAESGKVIASGTKINVKVIK